MPKHEILIPLTTTDTEEVMGNIYLSLQELQWNIQYGGETSLLANTAISGSKGQQILCLINEEGLVVSSEMIHNEVADVLGKNKKNTRQFEETYQKITAQTDPATTETALYELSLLRIQTVDKIEVEEREAAEIDAAMNLSKSNLYVTYGIIALNILIFIAMIIDGAGLFTPNALVHLKWGSNYSPLTLTGDWWRLISSIFIHFGIIHLLMNMYCLYTVGVYLEPMLGKLRYLAAYLCTGLLASLVSLWWHAGEPVNSAGASGAVFGMYGVFLALLTSNLIPKKVKDELLKSILLFIAFNLLYGLKGGIDNSAHIGGLLSGFVFGYGLVWTIKKEREERPVNWLLPLLVIISVGSAAFYLQQNKGSQTDRIALLKELKNSAYADEEKLNNQLLQFDEVNESLQKVLNEEGVPFAELSVLLSDSGVALINKANNILARGKNFDISPTQKEKVNLLIEYVELRNEELLLLKKICDTQDAAGNMPELRRIRTLAYNRFGEAVSK